MHSPNARLRFSLSSLPATSFTALEHALIEESHERLLPFDEYLVLCSFAEEISFERRRALALLSTLRDAGDNHVALTIESLSSLTSMTPRGAAYLLYLLGAYSEAGDIVEKALQQADPATYDAVAGFQSAYKSALNEEIASVVQDLAAKIPLVEHSVRIKRPASILAKLVSNRLCSDNRGATLDSWLNITLTPPYDVIGCRLVVECPDLAGFGRLVDLVLSACRSISDVDSVRVHRRYSIQNLHGASLLLNMRTSTIGHTPVQVQLWNVAASRYEWLCHGNHKVNHRLSPLLPNWLELCARPIDRSDFARAVARRWSVC